MPCQILIHIEKYLHIFHKTQPKGLVILYVREIRGETTVQGRIPVFFMVRKAKSRFGKPHGDILCTFAQKCTNKVEIISFILLELTLAIVTVS